MTVLSVQAATVLAKKTRLTWVNGIAHNLDHMSDGQISISTLFGGKRVEFCHNPTAMTSDTDYVGYIGDLSQAGAQKLGKITSEVDELVRADTSKVPSNRWVNPVGSYTLHTRRVR